MTTIPPSAFPIKYDVDNSAVQKFWDHLLFLLPHTIARTIKETEQVIENHPLETLANRCLSWVPTLPRAITRIDEATRDPMILNIFFATSTLFTIHLMIYPLETLKALKWTHDFFIDKIPALQQVKFWSSIALYEITIALSLRVAGRLYNKKLLENFYNNHLK